MTNDIKLDDCVRNEIKKDDCLNLDEEGDDYFDDDFELNKDAFYFSGHFYNDVDIVEYKNQQKMKEIKCISAHNKQINKKDVNLDLENLPYIKFRSK